MSIKSFINKTIVKIAILPVKILGKLSGGSDYISSYSKNLVLQLEKEIGKYCTLKKRQATLSDFCLIERENEVNQATAILMQGQVVREDNFTEETVRIYNELFPGTLVIVSTWEGENKDVIDKLRKLPNCEVVLSKYPSHSGLLNLNYQVRSTLAGLERAAELGRQYVFKTRCDYRFYKKGLITFLYGLLQTFPISLDMLPQKYRLLAGGEIKNSMFRPFWLADQFNYGNIDDMLMYWDYAARKENLRKSDVDEICKRKHYTWNQRTMEHLAAEPELVIDFLKRVTGSEPEISVRAYWKAIQDRFIVVSREDLGFYWFKYIEKYDESASDGTYYDKDSTSLGYTYNWDFAQWLSLYLGLLKYDYEYEKFANANKY